MNVIDETVAYVGKLKSTKYIVNNPPVQILVVICCNVWYLASVRKYVASGIQVADVA